MPRPANGTYNLYLPPIPYPMLVMVNDSGIRKVGETTVYPYAPVADGFSIAPDCALTCDGNGHWTLIKADATITGTCSPA